MVTQRKILFKKLVRFIQSTAREDKFRSIYSSEVEDYSDDEGNCLLSIASAYGKEQIVRFLAPLASITIDKENNYGWTPLMQACRNGHLSIVLFLLSRGANPNHQTVYGLGAMSLAVRSGSSQCVKALINNGYSGGNGQTIISPEMMAVNQSRDDILHELTTAPTANIDNLDGNLFGLTPLMLAARENDITSVRMILAKSGNILKQLEKRDISGRRAAENARSHGNVEMRNYLEKKAAKIMDKISRENDANGLSSSDPEQYSTSALINAIKEGDSEYAMRIISSQSLSEKRLKQMCSSDGATPLMYACMTGQLDLVEALVHRNVDVNAQDYENGWTALMQATYYGHAHIAKYLVLEANADVLIPAKNNLTVFDMAMLINLTDTELFRLLASKAMKLTMKPDKPVSQKEQVSSVGVSSAPQTATWFSRMSSKMLPFRSSKVKHDATVGGVPSLPIGNAGVGGSGGSNSSPAASAPRNSTRAVNDGKYGRLMHGLPIPEASPYGATDWLEPIQPPARFRHAVDEQLVMSQRVKNELTANGILSDQPGAPRPRIVKPGKFLKNNSKYSSAARKTASDSSSTLTPARSLSSLGSIHDVQSVLRKLKLTKYQHIFEEQEIDLQTFMTLSHDDLSDIGVTQDISREKLIMVVRQLANFHKVKY